MDPGGWRHHGHSLLQPSFFSPVVAICEMAALRALQLPREGHFASLILTNARITEPVGAFPHSVGPRIQPVILVICQLCATGLLGLK